MSAMNVTSDTIDIPAFVDDRNNNVKWGAWAGNDSSVRIKEEMVDSVGTAEDIDVHYGARANLIAPGLCSVIYSFYCVLHLNIMFTDQGIVRDLDIQPGVMREEAQQMLAQTAVVSQETIQLLSVPPSPGTSSSSFTTVPASSPPAFVDISSSLYPPAHDAKSHIFDFSGSPEDARIDGRAVFTSITQGLCHPHYSLIQDSHSFLP
jgi:hypothetical protein